MSIVGTLLGANENLTISATTTVTATSTNGASWVVFAADTQGWGATPITDNKGNVYTQIGTNVTAGFGVTGTLWYKENGVGGASHTWTATPSISDIATLIVVEITGGALSGLLDKFVTGNDDVATPFTSSATAATSQANELVLAFEYDNRTSGSAISWGGGYSSLTDLTNTSAVTAAAAKLNVAAIGAQQSSFTNADTTEAVTYIATFKEAGAAGAAFDDTGYVPSPQSSPLTVSGW